MRPTIEHLVERVYSFHLKHALHIGEGSTLPVQLMRTHLIMEEASEGLLALHNQDEEKFIDSLGDVMYVAAGSWVAVHGPSIPRMSITHAQEQPGRHNTVSRFLRNTRRLNNCLVECDAYSWGQHEIMNLILASIALCAEAGYDPIEVFNAIADSNDTKQYKVENGQRVKDKGPDFRAPVLTQLLKGGEMWKSSCGR